ncbi:MAG: methyl-accepting chemotaxis protein [Oscillospiraceae bacterium]|nr:methyl-accepting chemotaxis protein [Oscillospiraceae bacterium]
MPQQSDFLGSYESKVTKQICKILRFMFLTFPVLLILSYAGIFPIALSYFKLVIPLGFAVTFFPTLLLKLKTPERIIKYISVISVGVIIGILALNIDVGIFITYLLMPLISAMYFDKKFTRRICVFGFVIMAIALYVRSIGLVEYETLDRSAMEWYTANLPGYGMEYILSSVVLVSVTGRARGLLDNLTEAEKTSLISRELSAVLKVLRKAITDSGENNKTVKTSSDLTFEKCGENMSQVRATVDGANLLTNLMDNVKGETTELAAISNKAYDATLQYGEVMSSAVVSMQNIERVSGQTGDAVVILADRTEEITGFSKTIREIAFQTKILSINASIESARAGEHGKGFAIVAQHVGELAAKSEAAAEQISARIDEVQKQIKIVEDSVRANASSASHGMEQINAARKEVDVMGGLQKELNHLTKQVADNCEQSGQAGERMMQMSVTMQDLTAESLSAVADIKASVLNQSKAIQSIEDVFVKVERLAEDLM